MAGAKSPVVPKERRIHNFGEVVLGYGKKQNLEEARRCPQCAVATCLSACPLNIDIPGFIRYLRDDDFNGALERIRAQNPFPAICGRICPAPCEPSCIFENENAAINIRTLERYAADFGRGKPLKRPDALSGKHVAIVGSGPAAMTAAFFLARAGHAVTMFEGLPLPGGMLRYGVPEFRLPQKVLDDQFLQLQKMGVQVRTGTVIGASIGFDDLLGADFQAVLLTFGAGTTGLSDIPGNHLGGVHYAQDFLLRLQMFSKTRVHKNVLNIFNGRKTAVIGGNYSALDVARTAVRLGQSVDLIFHGLEEQMNVHEEDLTLASEEGVRINAPLEAIAIEADEHGFAHGVRCRESPVVEEGGHLKVDAGAQGVTFLDAQTVILDYGFKANAFVGRHLPQVRWNPDQTIWTDAATGMTNIDKLFAAGDAATFKGSVVEAMASGKSAAQKINQYLL